MIMFLIMFLLLTVRFSNGSVKNADKLDFAMYKNSDESNPRKKSRRILVRKIKCCFHPQRYMFELYLTSIS